MFGPGAYRPDPSAGITVPAALPQPASVPERRTALRPPCPRCGHAASRDKQSQRTLPDLGHRDGWCPRDLRVPYAQHSWMKGRQSLHAARCARAPPGRHETPRGSALAVRSVGEAGGPARPARGHLGRDHRVCGPGATLHNGGEAGGKKAPARLDTACLAWAWADVSGDVAADALEDGPGGMLAAGAQRGDKRLRDDV